MRSRLTPLVKLLYNPLQAMADLRSRAPYVAGAALAVTASLVYYNTLNGNLIMFLSTAVSGEPALASSLLFLFVLARLITNAVPVLFLAVVFVPACLLGASLIDRRSSFGALLRQEYAPFVSCVLYGWAAAHLLMLGPALLIFQSSDSRLESFEAAVKLVPLPYFIFLVALAARVVLRLSYRRAVGAVAIGAFSLVALPLIPGLLLRLTSPFALILLFFLLRHFFGNLLATQRVRERFKQNLEAATLNPADASAHYNLGLIYQQRGQYQEAKPHFLRAVEIDPDETDAHYQLGRIAREEAAVADAIAFFDQVVRRDPRHSQNEIWREIGRTYYQAEQHEDARAAFERFLESRPSDAEGHYYYGLTFHRLGRAEDAATEMRAVIEAVRTSPAYKYRAEKHWMNEAQSFLRSQSA